MVFMTSICLTLKNASQRISDRSVTSIADPDAIEKRQVTICPIISIDSRKMDADIMKNIHWERKNQSI